MNKEQFISLLANTNSISKVEANNMINIFVSGVKTALSRGESINLIGFGQFYTMKTKPRKGVNPRTGDPITIGERNQPKFKAGKSLKDICN